MKSWAAFEENSEGDFISWNNASIQLENLVDDYIDIEELRQIKDKGWISKTQPY